jgi:4-hydroxy-3-methylbut-2-enyl diphosphate reductase
MTKLNARMYYSAMIVVRAKILGMCMGVRRAEDLARRAADTAREKHAAVFTYGPLIHNPQAVAELKRAGVSSLNTEDFDSGLFDTIVRGSIVVIRAHGAPPKVFEHLAALEAQVIDATCPRVLKIQKKARELVEAGFAVIIAGDRSHGEVMGILGYAPMAHVVQSAQEARALALALQGSRVALIAQTTIKRSEFEAIAKELRSKVSDFLEVDTLCPATSERQKALFGLADRVSALVVVGGKNSANTQRLYMSARESGKPSWHIEIAEELPSGIFSFESVGLTAGASTPDSMVDEVERYLLGSKP